MINRNVLLAVLGFLTIAADAPGPVGAPSFKVGDTWIFDQTVERGAQGRAHRHGHDAGGDEARRGADGV